MPHLITESFALSPGDEWSPSIPGWWLLHVQSGAGYVLSSGTNHQLDPGAVLRLASHWPGRLLASQISPLRLRAFRVDPARLPGLISVTDEQFFREAANQPELSFRFFLPSHPLAHVAMETFGSVQGDLVFRVNALRLFVETFGPGIRPGSAPAPGPENSWDASERLAKVLREIPVGELIHLNLDDLVDRVHCTPRHFSRLFRELVGVSFRQKQTQVRLDRALELLSRADRKVVDVAFESGFGSVSLFNTLFKRRFRVPPRQWRENLQSRSRSLGR